MEIKGTAVKSIPEYVRKSHPDKLNEWMQALPPESKSIFEEGVITGNWYDMMQAAVVPTEKIGEVLFNDIKKGAWESGRFSAEIALNGIYKLYVKFSSPAHIIDRAGRVFSAYYQGSVMNVLNKNEDSVQVEISSFGKPNEVIEYRIGGWMECALEISGCKKVNVEIRESMARGDARTLYHITW